MSVMPRSSARCTHAMALFFCSAVENVNHDPNAISETMSSLPPSLRYFMVDARQLEDIRILSETAGMMPAWTAYPDGGTREQQLDEIEQIVPRAKVPAIECLARCAEACTRLAGRARRRRPKSCRAKRMKIEEEAQKLAMLELDQNLANRTAARLAQVERALKKIDEGYVRDVGCQWGIDSHRETRCRT